MGKAEGQEEALVGLRLRDDSQHVRNLSPQKDVQEDSRNDSSLLAPASSRGGFLCKWLHHFTLAGSPPMPLSVLL